MSQERLHEVLNYILLGVGTGGTATASYWADLDFKMGILVKCVSLASFICYLLINQTKIEQGWSKFKSRFKKK